MSGYSDTDDAKASGRSLEMGSSAYQNLVLGRVGLNEDERERILASDTPLAYDRAIETSDEPDAEKVEYHEQLVDEREAVVDDVVDDADERTRRELYRLESEQLMRESQAAAVVASIRAMADDTTTHIDDSIVEEIAMDVMDAASNRDVSIDEFASIAADARDDAEQVIDEVQSDLDEDEFIQREPKMIEPQAPSADAQMER